MSCRLILLWTMQALIWKSLIAAEYADKVNMLHQEAWNGNVTAVKELLSYVAADTRLTAGGLTALYRAAQGGHRLTMQELLLAGADVNAEVTDKAMDLDGWPYDLLRFAVRSGDLTAVEYLLKAGANVSSRTVQSQYTPLHEAVQKNRLKAALFLIENKADFNADSTRGPPLSIAAREGFLEMIALLANQKADLNGAGTERPPVLEAIKARKEEAALKLFELGADVNVSSTYIGLKPMHLAVKYSTKRVIEYLMKKGLVNQRDKNGRTPLYVAEHGDITEMLIEGGALLNAVTDKGETPLHYAAYKDNYDVVEILITKGAKLDMLSNETYDIKNVINDDRKVVKLLLKKKTKLRKKGAMGFTPLAIAIWARNARISFLLIKNKSSINIEGAEWPPLHVAAYLGDINITKELLKAGADINLRDSVGSTALHKATMRGMTEEVRVLIKAGANVNASDLYGWTPLHVAAKYHREDIAEILINAGCDVSVEDGAGFTALIWAEAGGHPFFLELMIEKTIDLSSRNRYDYIKELASDDIAEIVNVTMKVIPTFDQDRLKENLETSIIDLNYNLSDICEKIRVFVGERNIQEISLEKLRKHIEFIFNKYQEEHIELISAILNETTDIDKQDAIMGWSTLHWAAAVGDMEVVKLLIEKGANFRSKSKLNQTPMYLARYWGHRNIYHYFRNLGALW